MNLVCLVGCLSFALVLPMAAAEEKVAVKLDGALLEFRAETIESNSRKVSPSELVIHEGKLYRSAFNPPHRVMSSGRLMIEGKEILLDVSGLANPWAEASLEKRFVRLEKEEFEKGATTYTLTVVFAKGGAADDVVEWRILGDKSMRVSIANCGDTYPEWVREQKAD